MKLNVLRSASTKESTPGTMFIDGAFFCFTLEDQERLTGPKVMHETAIPRGTYRLVLDHSQRFDRIMPHVLDVPGFAGIRIHAGTRESHTSGCILVGYDRTEPTDGTEPVLKQPSSTKAFNDLFNRIVEAKANGEDVSLTIEGI